MKIRTVCVDLWGTLFVDTPGSDNRYKPRRLADFDSLLRGEGHAFTMGRLERAYEDSGAYLRRVWAANRDVPVGEHVNAILRALDPRLADGVHADLRAALVQAYARPALLVPPALDDTAAAAFARLREQDTTLVLVSNVMRTPGTVLRALLAKAGVLQYFAATVFSDEVGIRKPDPEIFRGALRAVGGEAATALHVGDDEVLDVEGGRAAGLRVVQVVGREGDEPPSGADRTITRLGDLPAAIRSLEAE
ncbi:MAG: HAD family hydrolase [Candidatus Rokubacteria bacterium]|nr:HAD family hydrolase [Candidatus Rokubacteria bacterium]